MSETKASTKIEDLPDNDQETSDLIQELDTIISDEESDTDVEPQGILSNNNNISQNVSKDIYTYIQDSVIIFILVILGNNTFMTDILEKIPYLNNYTSNSLVLNAVIALIISISFVIVKYILEMV